MKFSFSKLTKPKEEQKSDKSVLFVCVENAGRSQMAEGFFRKYAPKRFMTLSAGTKPSGGWNRHKQPKIKGSYRRYDKKFYKNSQYGLYG
jgi:hypothetical protein